MLLMPFEPLTDGHAISEVVFGLVFERPFSTFEMSTFLGNHEKFKDRLPGKSQIAMVPISIGGAPIPLQGAGIAFSRFNNAGAIEQRLRLEGNAVFVNTMQYSRWDAVSDEAYSLLDECVSTAKQSDLNVVGAILQYIDVFRWDGEITEYNLSELLDEKGSFFPKSIFDRGHLWHLHQGWFKKNNLPENGNLLERITTDGITNEESKAVVRVDCYLGFDFSAPLPFQSLRSKPEGRISLSELFGFLHFENKSIMASCLTESMREKIGLNG